MTLVGLLPPLCENGNMLVDGGYCESSHILCGIFSFRFNACSGQLAGACSPTMDVGSPVLRQFQVSTMMSMGASAVIASDVGSVRVIEAAQA